MAASSSPSSGGRWNYDVFLNFRGDDTRKIFVGHLHKALNLEAINAFIDSEDLRKGNDLSELLRAIEDSRLSIVVFSPNYASSTWCLKELVKILECMSTKKQLVVPIFYEVDPSDIRKVNGRFAEAFVKHEHDSNADMEEVHRWKSALTEATNLSGWDSRNYKDDAKFIEEIVEDISKKLVHIRSNKASNLVGMDSHIAIMSSLLNVGEDDVRVVGVYGMPGIGKTTIARAVYDGLVCQFDHYCFLENVKEGFEHNGAIHMQEELLSRIFEKSVRSLGTLSRGSKMMMMDRLSKKKVLLVLDDVENFNQIEELLGRQHSFGGGSRIIVTTRDVQSLSGVTARYSPKFLRYDEALKLFMQYAFRTNQPTREYDPLSRRAVEYAQGLPLALKVLGASLHGKSISEWEDELEKIKEIPHKGIEGVLRTSFDGLDPSQQDIFLDIACFFRGMNEGYVIKILENCGFYPHSGLQVLRDRALLTISYGNRLEMHDLIQDMGWQIVRQQSIKEPGKRSRLWTYEDVDRVLAQNTATEAVEGIMLDLSKSKDVDIDAEAFVRMTNLRLLLIGYNRYLDFDAKDFPLELLHQPGDECKQHVSGVVKFLSRDLRYLMWHGCPLKSLPSNFCPKNLVDLDMRFSHIEQLWEGIKPFKKLKFINLSHSHYLTTTPDFTEATNVETLVLDGCSSLLDVNSSISALKNLVFLCLRGCKELQSLPSSIFLKSLKILDLSGCSSLVKFPEISGIMEDLSEIFLNETAIEELPSSIERLQGLVLLHLINCRSLVRLPDNICNLACLKDLTLSGCSKLYHLPENLGNLESLMYLEVEGSGIRELPFSILGLKRLKTLSCDGCKEMTMPFSSWSSSIEEYNCSYSGLQHLDLSDSNLWELSDGIAHLSSLKTLELRRTNLESLPATMNQLRRLTRLELEACKRLKSIPELPSSINYIDAHDCRALETVGKPNTRCSMNLCFTFSNCLQLVQTNLFRDIVETHSHHQGNYPLPLSFNMSLPGSEIPDWFIYQCRGSSLTVPLPPNWFDNKFLGFAICAVSDFKGSRNDASDLSALCHCGLKGNHGQYSFSFTLLDWGFTTDRILESDHMFMAYVPWSEYRFIEEGKLVNERYFTEATFEIVVENRVDRHGFGTVINRHCITSCGVRFFHGDYLGYREEQILSISETKSHHDSCDILSVSRKGKEGVGVRLEESPVERSSAGERTTPKTFQTNPKSMATTWLEALPADHKKVIIKKLVRGRDIATELQSRLNNLRNVSTSLSAQELVMEILTSYTEGLSVLSESSMLCGDDDHQYSGTTGCGAGEIVKAEASHVEQSHLGDRSSEDSDHKKVIMKKLVRGRDSATELQSRLSNGSTSLLAQELVMEIVTSFTESLSVLSESSKLCGDDDHQYSGTNGCGAGEIVKAVASHVEQSHWGDRSSEDSESRKRPGYKDRRDCYKRRKNSESWSIVSTTVDDGLAWRKYGQKEILNAPYPRAYFRCARKYDQGCQATKQVQRVQDTPIVYKTTYIGTHTCRNMIRGPQMIMGASDPPTWPTPICSEKEHHGDLSSSLSLIPFVPEKKEECKEGTTASGLVDNVNDPSDMWTDFESLEFVFPDLGTEQSP